MDQEQMYQGLLEAGYTEKQISKYLDSELTEEKYTQLVEAKAEKISVGKQGVFFKYVNHNERATKMGRLSDNKNIAPYLNVALEYFEHRCALSGEEFVTFEKSEKPINSRVRSNLSAEHVVALCQGGDDVYPNLVPSVYQYNLQKYGYYLLDWWTKQKNSNPNEQQTLYSPYRLLKLVNYMMKSLDARKQDLTIEQYKEAILTPNEIDEFLSQIENQDRQEPNNSKRRIISDNKTTTEIDEDGKRILQTIPEIEGNIPRLDQQLDRSDDRMMAIFLYDSIHLLREDRSMQEHKEYEQIMSCLDTMYKRVRGVISFEIWVRNKVLKKIEELGVKDNKYSAANSLLYETDLLAKAKENPDSIDEYLSRYFEEKKQFLSKELELTDDQIQTAITNIPEILYDKDAARKVDFYKQYRPQHLNTYLNGKNNKADSIIDTILILQSIGVEISLIAKADTLEELAQKSCVSIDKIIEVGLDPKQLIGRTVYDFLYSCKGTNNHYAVTNEQKSECKNLIILSERDTQFKNAVILIKVLQNLGIDTSVLVTRDKIGDLAIKTGLNIETIEEAGLDPNFCIGRLIENCSQAYRKMDIFDQKVETYVKELKKLGISLERQENNAIQNFIDKMTKLSDMGINTSEIRTTDTMERLAKKSGIERTLLINNGLNPDEKVGETLKNIRRADDAKRKARPATEAQKTIFHALGISLDRKSRKVKARSIVKQVVVEQKKKEKLGENMVMRSSFEASVDIAMDAEQVET